MWWKEMEWKMREYNEKEMKKWIGNRIGDEGAKTMSESLKINTSLTELDLRSDEKDKKWKRGKWSEKEENE